MAVLIGTGVLLAAVLGGALASFAGVVAERRPTHVALSARSRCVCDDPIVAWALLPAVGRLVVRGRARCCGVRLPVAYAWTEIALAVAAAVASVAFWLLFGRTGRAPLLALLPLAAVLVTGFGTSWQTIRRDHRTPARQSTQMGSSGTSRPVLQTCYICPVTTPTSFRPDEETERALRELTADGRSRGEVIREAVLRLYREDFIHRCAEDARRLTDDPEDAVHMRRIAAEMRELNAW